MALIKSISGIRGTIGGVQGENLTPIDIVKFTASYAEVLLDKREKKRSRPLVVIGRDARKSGKMVSNLISNTLNSMGVAVLDIGLSTTPTVEMEVVARKADGGIIITASHNPAQWNALKLLNEKGEFLSAEDGELVLQIAENYLFIFSETKNLGEYFFENNFIAIDRHINAILKLDLVDTAAIAAANFKVAIDCVNSTGGFAIPRLLKKLGVNEIHKLHYKSNGKFPHNPEPLPEHLTDLSNYIKKNRIDVGFAVDPDVDRLAIVMENGKFFGEEYTLVAVADYVLQHTAGNTVSNLSSTQALKIVTKRYDNQHFSAAVGEVNVVEKMKEVNAVIG
jgi:phosphomannomutase